MRRWSPLSAVVGSAVVGTLVVVGGLHAAIRPVPPAAPLSPIAAHRRAGGGRGSRVQNDADDPPNVSECETTRGTRLYGSAERCRRVLCTGRNVTNAFVTDGTQRLRRNPCAGVDPFDRP